MIQTREIPFPKGCGADDVVITQVMRDGYWIDTGIRKLSDTTMISDIETGLSGSHQQHARLSPSDSKRWTSCSASIAFQEANAHRVPKDTSSRDSNLGTLAHDWAAKVLVGECTKDDLPEEFKECVGAYVDYCLSHIAEGASRVSYMDYEDAEAFGEELPAASFHVEEQIDLWYQPEQKGTADFVALTSEVVDVIDYKNGGGVLVLADQSTQLAIYGYSFIKKFERFFDFTPATIVRLHIFQPNHREGKDQTPWELTLADLASFCWHIEHKAIQAREGANRVREKIGAPGRDVSPDEILEAAPGLVFSPEEGDGGSCRWCVMRATCSKRLEANTEGIDLPGLPAEDLLAAMPDLDKDEKKLPVEERISLRASKLGIDPLPDSYLVEVYARMKGIKSWLSDIEEFLEGRLLDGHDIPGVCLAMGREGNREWANEEAADTFLAGQKVSADDRYTRKLVSPTQAEKLLKGKELSTRAQNRFAELITRSPAKRTIALATDDRPAVGAAISAMPDLEIEDAFEV